jgi:DNA-binding NarL/FixJ family response regulator
VYTTACRFQIDTVGIFGHDNRSTMNIIIVIEDVLHSLNARILLEGEPGITVHGAYSNAQDALESLRTFCPDIMLTNIVLPGMTGAELIARAKEMRPELEILVYTSHDDRDNLLSALKAGAGGYILKGGKPRELLEAVQNLHDGGAPLSPQIARKVIQEFHAASVEAQHLLTAREKDVIGCIDKGMSYKELATRLNISINTVHTHITKIYEKLRATSRKDALVKARRKGLI